MSAPVHLIPTAPVAERALLPGDPGRALLLAQALLESPRMSNHNRGLWGYTGTADDGAPLTIQSTGMGGPSAAIVLEELAMLGVRTAVRVGTCGALGGSQLALGDLVAAREALCEDGTSRALGAGDRVGCDPQLGQRLSRAVEAQAGAVGLVASTDVFYERDGAREDGWRAAGALAVEMETATLFRLGELLGIAVGCALTVSDVLGGPEGRARLGAEELEAAGERVGRIAWAALA